MCREQQNSTERIRINAVDVDGAGVTGATVLLSIRRDVDGQYWDGAAFGASFNTVNMSETDATNRAGEYHYDFNTTGLSDANYSIRATTAAARVVNDPFEGEIKIGGFVDNIDAAISSRSTITTAEVNTEVDTALGDYDGPTNTEMVAAFTEIKGATFTSTDTLEAIRDRGDAAWITATGFSTHSAADVWASGTRTLTSSLDPTAATIADAIWDEATVGHTTSGTFGEQVKTDVDAILADTDSLDTTKITTARADNLDNLDAAISTRSSHSASDVTTDIDANSTKLDVAVSTRSSHSAADVWAAATRTLTASSDPTAAQIADAVLDEIISGHLTAGSVGDYLDRIKKIVFNRLVVSGGAYTVYADDGTTPFSTGTTSASDGDRTPA